MLDAVQILTHWYAGRPKAEVAPSIGVDRKTVDKYVTSAEEAGYSPGGPEVSAEAWRQKLLELMARCCSPRQKASRCIARTSTGGGPPRESRSATASPVRGRRHRRLLDMSAGGFGTPKCDELQFALARCDGTDRST